MANPTHEYIISYDIAAPKRLARIFRIIKTYALPLQYSVFYARIDRCTRDSLITELQAELKSTEDDLRIYTLAKKFQFNYIGENPFPDGLNPSTLDLPLT
ncbi:MAG: CRISPR-associated endonuclease Cas2 [Thiotrichales bacterium]